jgi:GTP pyrophosphokinase
MTSVSSHVAGGREQAMITVTLEVEDLSQMQRVLNKLEKVKGVVSVERNLGQRGR